MNEQKSGSRKKVTFTGLVEGRVVRSEVREQFIYLRGDGSNFVVVDGDKLDVRLEGDDFIQEYEVKLLAYMSRGEVCKTPDEFIHSPSDLLDASVARFNSLN